MLQIPRSTPSLKFAKVNQLWAQREPAGLVSPVQNSHCQPDEACILGPILQAVQQSKTESNAEAGEEGIEEKMSVSDRLG
jgi:hypothetical protein